MLGEYFQELVGQLKNEAVRFVWFDFHHECRKMKYENLSKLVDQIKDNLASFSFFSASIPKANLEEL